jgi:hypothetical protein
MRAFLGAAVILGVLSTATNVGFSQAKPSMPSLEGVWKTSSVVATGPTGNSIPDRPFNINIWTRKFYSRITADGPTRPVLPPPKDPAKLTNAEKLARYEHWNQIGQVTAGTYEIKGTQWFQYELVGKSQSADALTRHKTGNLTFATTPPIGQEIKLEGNTLVLIQTSNGTRRTYTRLDTPPRTGTTPHPIEGVWKATSTVRTGPDPASNPNRLPNIFIYKNGYYTFVAQDAGPTLAPRQTRTVLAPAKDPANLTEAEKLARYEHWAQVQGNAGRYEVKGTTLYQYALLGMNEGADMTARRTTGNMGTVAPNSELVFSNGNNTMVQVNKSADGKSETRRTYTRFE